MKRFTHLNRHLKVTAYSMQQFLVGFFFGHKTKTKFKLSRLTKTICLVTSLWVTVFLTGTQRTISHTNECCSPGHSTSLHLGPFNRTEKFISNFRKNRQASIDHPCIETCALTSERKGIYMKAACFQHHTTVELSKHVNNN